MEGTKAFLSQAVSLHETSPQTVATDGLTSYPRMHRTEFMFPGDRRERFRQEIEELAILFQAA